MATHQPDLDMLIRADLPAWIFTTALISCFISFVGTLAHAIMNWIMPRRFTVRARIYSGVGFVIALIATAQLLRLIDYRAVPGIFTVPAGVIVMEIVKQLSTTPPARTCSIPATDMLDAGRAKQ